MAADSPLEDSTSASSPPSISFDRAVDIYDATRGFPPGIAPQVAAALLRWLSPTPQVLEIGVGTGRIGLPLAQAGAHVTGIDVSLKMMLRLRENALKTWLPAGRWPAICQASGANLPLPPHQFDAVLAVHLLHLIPEWRQVVAEARRVLRPGGSFVIGYDNRSDDEPYIRVRNYWREAVVNLWQAPDYRWRRYYDEIRAELISQGARVEDDEAAAWPVSYTLEETLAKLRQRAWSATWEVPEEPMQAALHATRQWAEATFGDLTRTISAQIGFIWQRYRWQ